MQEDEIYEKREQTRVKHYILRHYLERFAHIVGSHWGSITYVDGFAGPWNVRSPELRDSSFAIALEELRKARETYRSRGRELQLRCCFLEQNREAYLQLQEFANRVADAEVLVLNDSFENSVDSILRFIRSGRQTFPFLFIDPTGWTGFRLKTISPLLRCDPGEVLINFMTSYIRRFPQSFVDLFDSPGFGEQIKGLSGLELDDTLVTEYMAELKTKGKFAYTLPAIVLHPEINRTHFHLIYATRHPKGVEVFKDTEKRAMEEMERVREKAQRRKREEQTGQQELLLAAAGVPESPHYNTLREHYLGLARQNLLSRLRRQGRVSYDEAWILALSRPLVWESDLREWIQDWRRNGLLRLEGLQGRERVPKREHSHFLVWQEKAR
ncbi:MAG TPA: three-Cys-motif partner protein TcmP [Thermoanaerobaculia bacterium]|jgi:three-Cys-motif partner protein